MICPVCGNDNTPGIPYCVYCHRLLVHKESPASNVRQEPPPDTGAGANDEASLRGAAAGPPSAEPITPLPPPEIRRPVQKFEFEKIMEEQRRREKLKGSAPTGRHANGRPPVPPVQPLQPASVQPAAPGPVPLSSRPSVTGPEPIPITPLRPPQFNNEPVTPTQPPQFRPQPGTTGAGQYRFVPPPRGPIPPGGKAPFLGRMRAQGKLKYVIGVPILVVLAAILVAVVTTRSSGSSSADSELYSALANMQQSNGWVGMVYIDLADKVPGGALWYQKDKGYLAQSPSGSDFANQFMTNDKNMNVSTYDGNGWTDGGTPSALVSYLYMLEQLQYKRYKVSPEMDTVIDGQKVKVFKVDGSSYLTADPQNGYTNLSSADFVARFYVTADGSRFVKVSYQSSKQRAVDIVFSRIGEPVLATWDKSYSPPPEYSAFKAACTASIYYPPPAGVPNFNNQ